MPRSEVPPSAKKLSSRPIRSWPSSSSRIAAIRASSGVRGRSVSGAGATGRCACAASHSADRSFRSASRGWPRWSGWGPEPCSREADRADTSPIHPPVSVTRFRRMPRAAGCQGVADVDNRGIAHRGWLRRVVSISPSSMRDPRTFTCWSRRPRNRSAPSGPARTKSPVRNTCAAAADRADRE